MYYTRNTNIGDYQTVWKGKQLTFAVIQLIFDNVMW